MSDSEKRVPISAEISKGMDDRIEAWRDTLPAETSKSAALRALIGAGLDVLAPAPKRKAAASQ